MRKWLALLLLWSVPALGVQVARPDSRETDVAEITGTYTDIDDDPNGDANNVSTSIYVSECASAEAEEYYTLSNVTDPAVSTGHIMRFECNQYNGGSLYLHLYQGTTLITTAAPNCNGLPGTYTLSAAEANSITDYNDLKIRVNPYSDDSGCACYGGCNDQFNLDYVQLEVPDAGGGATRRVFTVQ